MRQPDESTISKPINYERFNPAMFTPDGQLCLYPNAVAKSHGNTVSEVFCRRGSSKTSQEVDDVCKRDGQELPIQARVLVEYSRMRVGNFLQTDLNWFDWEVMDSIATLAGKPGDIIYLDDIYRVIVGKKAMYPVTEKQKYMVNESVEKMRNMPVEIKIVDLFEEDSPINAALQAKGIRSGSIRNYLIPCEILEYRGTSRYAYGIRLLDSPPLFAYAKTLGLASLYPLALVDTPLTKTRNTIVLQSFLLRSIDQMYRDRDSGNEFSTLIKMKDVYSVVGSTKDSDTEKARNRKKAEQLLDFWVKKNYITGYAVEREATGRKPIKGYQISLFNGTRTWPFLEQTPARISE